MASDSELMPTVLTDFIFDLYQSVTMSQIPEEQAKLYEVEFRDLTQKYFSNQPWPGPQAVAGECNGDPLFLAVYRELTHRHWHAVSRTNLRDRLEGWQVYQQLFEEVLDSPNFFLLPSWTFDILNEFVYQFQGFCQIRSAVYAQARKQGLLNADGSRNNNTSGNQNLIDNINTLENSKDSWEVEMVFQYLHRLAHIGWPKSTSGGSDIPVVYTHFSIFSAVATSRLECLLGDYTASLQALDPIYQYGEYLLPKVVADDDKRSTVSEVLATVFGARLSIAYHAGISLLLLRRYRDATNALASMCAMIQRGSKTGQLRWDQYNKQFERMLAVLALLIHISPPPQGMVEESVLRAVREKHGAKLETASSFEEWFQSPKFISADPMHGVYRQQIQRFGAEMEANPGGKTIRSYLRLYTSLPLEKLAHFHDMESADDFIPLLLAYKLRMRQMERNSEESSFFGNGASFKSALDFHFYLKGDTVLVEHTERERRMENYFVAHILQDLEIRQTVLDLGMDL